MKITRLNYESYFLDYAEGNLAPTDVAELMVFLEANPDLAEELELLDATPVQVPQEIFDSKDLLKKDELPISQNDLDNLLARELEGDLTSEDSLMIASIEKNFPAIHSLRAAFAKTKLPAEKIIFDDKSSIIIPDAIDYSDVRNLMVGSLEGDLSLGQIVSLNKLLESNPSLKKEFALFQKTKLSPEVILFDAKATLIRKEAKVIPLGKYFAYVAAAASVALLLVFSGTENPVGKIAHQVNPDLNTRPVQEVTTSQKTSSDDVAVIEVKPLTPKVVPVYREENDLAVVEDNTPRVKNNYSKLDHIGPKTFAVNYTAGDLIVKTHEPGLPDDVAMNSPETAVNRTEEEYSTILQLFEQKAKSRLWGDQNYPDDKFALEWAERTIEKQTTKETFPVQFEREREPDVNTFRFRIGKFEFERKKRSF